MKIANWIALLLSVLAVAASALVSGRVYNAMPHLEDEIAYVWQARLAAEGKLTIPSPEHADSFLVPFVIDYNGLRFGKYPPGWPAMLSLGVRAGLRDWVNPLLAGLVVWLIYRLGQKLFGETVGLIAAGLTVVSPFFLINTGSLLSHPWGLVLATAFALFWLDVFWNKDGDSSRWVWLKLVTMALVLGLLILSRPFTAVGVVLPFAIHGVYLLIRGSWVVRRQLLGFALLVLLLSGLLFVWQFSVTGDPLLNPYTLWWDYDILGFGVGHGVLEGGHSLHQGWVNTKFSLRAGYRDLFGWGTFSWIFLPFGLLALKRNWRGWLVAAIFPSLVLIYVAYWVGSWLFGPRYYFEGLQSLVLVSALGIAWLAGWPTRPGEPFPRYAGWQRLRPLAVTGLVALLVSLNLLYYLPPRLAMMHDLYGIGPDRQAPFKSPEAQALTPALFIVHVPRWMPYGALLDLENPELTSPMIFAIGVGPNTDDALAQDYPDRNVYQYYPDEPWKFYTERRSP